MDREVAEGLRMGVVLTFLGAILVIGLLAFMLARHYSGDFFDKQAEQQREIEVVGLMGLSSSGSKDMPVASLYAILAREWRSVASVTVIDKNGVVITTGTPGVASWSLTAALINSAGSEISTVSGPEQVLYAKAPNARGDRLEGRAYVTVTRDAVNYGFHVSVKRMS